MAVGLITNPATWLLGTVAAPTWFQNVQDNLNGLIGGTGPTLASLQVDGAGGAASALGAGIVKSNIVQVASLGASGTTLPTPAPTFGSIYKDLCVVAALVFTNNGSVFGFTNPYNIQSAVRNSVGNYTFTFVTNPAQTPLVSTATQTAGFISVNVGPSTFTVITANTSNTATDFNAPVHVTMLGR